MRRRDRWLIAIVVVVALLVAVRAALPSLVRDFLNDKLQALEGYDGHVEDVDLALWRGAYGIDDIEIVRTGASQRTPFFKGERLEELFPFRFNTVAVHNGTITFRAPGISTNDAIKARRVEGEVTNLTNVAASGKETFATFKAAAEVLDGGATQISGSIDPLAPKPTFDVNLQVQNVKLPQVNPWLRQYIKADAEAGDFELYREIAAADGKFQGYAKPVLRNVNIYSSEEPEENFLKRIWEGLVDFAANVFENEEQVAARIPFSGTIDNPKAGILATVVSVLRNAFVSAFARPLTRASRDLSHGER